MHPHGQNEFWTEYEYTLDELADHLDLRGHPLRGIESVGLGRNCELFESVRKWAYKAIRDYWAPNYKRVWNSAVYEHVEALNGQFNQPLPVSEVKSIAKSIANWTYKSFTPEVFRASQAKKGAKGGKISKGGGRPQSYDVELYVSIKEMKVKGYSNRVIAEDLNVSPSTVSKYLKISKE